LITAATEDKDTSREVTYNLRDLSVTNSEEYGLVLQSPRGQAHMTHWGFGQLARIVKAPAGYLRTLPPANIAADLTHGLQDAAAIGSSAVILARPPKDGESLPMVRAVTTETYGRAWDADFYDGAQSVLFNHRSSGTGSEWIQPPTWDGGSAGTWRGDRDSFVIRVDGGSIVTDPTIPNGDGKLYRGTMLRNSEVGGGALVIDWVLFQYICGNLNLWGATIDRRFTRRHVGQYALRDTLRELATTARQWTQRSASQDEAIIRQLIDREIAHTDAAVVDELRKVGYTVDQANAAVDTCKRHFNASPRSAWGIAQGTTKMSQQAEYQDDRYTLDQLASKLTAKMLRRVAA
jgi:hypothetical protein